MTMTTELTKAAQQALEALEEIALAGMSGTGQESEEGMRDWHARQAWKFIGIAARALDPLKSALTQRPAAQEVPDGVWEALQRLIENGEVMGPASREDAQLVATYRDRVRFMALPSRPAPAETEPVGEPNQFPPMPEGWPARFRCDSCDGNGEIGELVSIGHFQPPERQTCPDCGGRGWTSEEPAFNAEHMREFAEARARNARPAPGVPEGFALVPVEPTKEMVKAGNRVGLVGMGRDGPAAVYAAMLAASQAKGGG